MTHNKYISFDQVKSSSKLAWHENVRLQVSMELINILRSIVRERSKIKPSLELVLLQSLLEDKVSEGIVVLMPQEVYVGSERYRVDAVFGGTIAFDYKSSEREFDQAVENATSKYLPHLKKVEYFVVTNYDSWRIYRVQRDPKIKLERIYEDGGSGAVSVLKQIITDKVEALKIPPHPASIEALYTVNADKLIKELREVFDSIRENDKVRPLFEAYKKIMKQLYGEDRSDGEDESVGEGFYADLFVKHTLMHMMVMASLAAALKLVGEPIDLCSGVLLTFNSNSLDIALPYLNWWKIAHPEMKEEYKSKVENVAEEVVARARLVDWELGSGEDVFRELYEFLVEPETRRRIGEYYTPLWIVDMILKEFKLKGKLVMDPFCGSGTFLVRAFYRKVYEEKEEPENAYEELVGFDVNPLAVAIARAELIIAFRRVSGKNPPSPPRIYHTDTLAAWYGGEALDLKDPEYTRVVNTVISHVNAKKIEQGSAFARMDPLRLLTSLSRIEQLLALGIKISLSSNEGFENELKDYLLKNLRNLREEDLLVHVFEKIVDETDFVQKLSTLVKKYGNGVWATTIISSIMPSMATVLKPHVIITNPPWVPMTRYKSTYIESIREKAKKILNDVLKIDAKRVASVVTGSDVACMSLYKALEIAQEGVGFVMPREQSFYARSPMRSGVLLTYAIIEKICGSSFEKCDVKLIDVDYDAFGHGNYPAVVVVKKIMEKIYSGEMRAG
ncbi:MAG: N-6 DNA methylase [Desulfurococcaceae archaeon]